MTREQQGEVDDVITLARQTAVSADTTVPLAQIDQAIAAATNDEDCGRLLVSRAIIRQGEADPEGPAEDAFRAFQLLANSGRNDEAALAAAVVASMKQRAGDVESAIEHGVNAMVLIDDANRTLVTARAANSIAVLFAQLSAFEQAIAYSDLALDMHESGESFDSLAAAYTQCYVAVEAHHAGVPVPLRGAHRAVQLLAGSSIEIGRSMLAPGMAVELACIEHPETAGSIPLELDAMADAAPRIAAWYQLVLAARCHSAGEHADAVRLLDVALPIMTSVRDDHRIIRAYRIRSSASAALGDMDRALADATAIGDMARGWHVHEVGRLAVQITRRAELEQQKSTLQRRATDLAQQVDIDELSGVGSRRFLETRLDELATQNGTVSVVMLDIDDFKSVNDRFGHAAGDAVLTRVGAALLNAHPRCDIIARLGGDEFVALFTDPTESTAIAFAEAVRTVLDRHDWETIAPELRVHISAGTATGSRSQVRSVVEQADAALYSAKRTGRNRSVTA